MLNNASLKAKVIYAASAIGIIAATTLGIVIYNTSVVPIQQEEKDNIIEEMTTFINSQINLKIQAGILGSTALSIDNIISEALEVEEREDVIPILSGVRDQFKNQTNYKNIQTQLITADGRSLVKSWDIDSYGQNLSNNPLIRNAQKEKQAFGSLAIGARGVSIIAISPVIRDNEMLGMVSMIQGLRSVGKAFTKKNKGNWILLVDRDYVKEKYGSMPIIEKNTVFSKKYIVSNDKWFPKDVINFAKEGFQPVNGNNKNVYLYKDKAIIDIPATDAEGVVFGRHLFLLDKSRYEAPIEAAVQSAKISLAGIILAIFLLAFGIVIIVNKLVIKPLQDVQKNTTNILKTGDFSIRNTVHSNDEVGKTSEAINALLEQIGLALKEANQTVQSISQGEFSTRITGNYQGDLATLKNGVNSSTEVISSVMNNLSQAMTAMRDGRYDTQIDSSNSTGSYKTMLEDAQQAFNETNLVISEINSVMMQMQQGNYNERVQIEAKGDLNTLKTHINESMEGLNSAIDDITRVVTSLSAGDLTHTIDNQYLGDLLTLKEAINHSIENLSGIVSQAVEAGSIVSNEADSLSADANNLSERIQQQAAAIEETSATMEEMNSAVQNNTQNAEQASEVVEKVQGESEQASEVMTRTIEAMNGIQDSSNEIAEIVTLIDSIAFQTNLLALNAAVEAARAGEHGRGFAVVAGEVRALAQKSADAAKDIKNLIDSSVQRIGQGTKLASESGDVLQGITDSINNVASMIHQINAASQEQAEGVSQVHHAISDIDSATQANATLVEKTSHTADNLNHQASQLNDNMAFFKTNTSPSNQTKVTQPVVAPIPLKETAATEVSVKTTSEPSKEAPVKIIEETKKPKEPEIQTYKPKKAEKSPASGVDEWAEF